MQAALHRVLTAPPTPLVAAGPREFWEGLTAARVSEARDSLATAALGGFFADRVAYAFLAGYQGAVHALFPIVPERLGSFCVTEAGGNHPRAVQAVLRTTEGQARLGGEKTWGTLAPIADELFVVAREASESGDGRERPSLRTARVLPQATGVTLVTRHGVAFVPEVPHAIVTLVDVAVSGADVLPGDAYALHVKPFRTAEDVHVHAALLGYLIGVARRFRLGEPLLEKLVASLAALAGVHALDATSPEAHVALAGVLASSAGAVDALDAAWAAAGDAEHERWQRDQALFRVAGKAREARRLKAWERLHADGPR